MKEDETMRRMARALRESRTGRHDDPGLSRAVILAVSERRRGRYRWGAMLLAPMAALLLFSTAWAAVSMGGHRALFRIVERALGIDTRFKAGDALQVARSSAAPSAAGLAAAATSDIERVPVAEVAAPHAMSMPLTAAPPEGLVKKQVLRGMKRKSAVRAVAAEPPASAAPGAPPVPPVDEEDDRLYARAHQAHFVGGDAATALAAWDAYLVAQPYGRFSIEAHYNRALCLIRLGRKGEARGALLPFAEGRYGDYRRWEARRLLTALGGASRSESEPAPR